MKELAKLKTVSVSAKGQIAIPADVRKMHFAEELLRLDLSRQIAIPADVRKMLGIKKGDRLLLTAASKKILIEKSNEITKNIEDGLSYLTKISERAAKKLWDNESDKIWDQL